MVLEPMEADVDESSVLSVVDVIGERCFHECVPCVFEGGFGR